jgi:hypothetical protein
MKTPGFSRESFSGIAEGRYCPAAGGPVRPRKDH